MEKKEYCEEVLGWIKAVEENLGKDAQLTLEACSKLKKYAKQHNDIKLQGYANYYYGETYYLLNDGENVFKYMTRALTYLDASKQWELVVKAYNMMAITSVNRGNHPIAMDYYLTALNYCKKYHILKMESVIHINIGTLYMSCGEYREAHRYIESAYRFIAAHKEIPEYRAYLIGAYYSLAKCYLLRNLLDKSLEYMERIEKECGDNLDSVELLYINTFKARLFHEMGKIARREESIAYVHKIVNQHIPILDVFDDMYEYCELLLEIKKDSEFWETIEVLEQLTKQAQILNMQRKLIALKIRFYRKNERREEYLQAAGLFYSMTEIMEKENRYMVANMLEVRRSLDRVNEKYRRAEQRSEALQKKSETDAMTGLPNRFRLNEHMESIFRKMNDSKSPLAVEILDIDYFKQYNDNYGHQAGDRCICALADELKKMQSEKILCTRYGGDEFVIVYQDMDMEEVFAQAEDLRQRILDLRIEHKYSETFSYVTISQGICWDIPMDTAKPWDYLHEADIMLYEVKKKKRNGVCMGNLTGNESIRFRF